MDHAQQIAAKRLMPLICETQHYVKRIAHKRI